MAKAKKVSPLVIVLALIGVLLLGAIAWGVTQSVTSSKDVITDASQCADLTSGKLTVNAVNALNKGTTVGSPTITAGTDGGSVVTSVTSGTTTFPIGSTVEVLVSKADYLDRSFSFVMPCGGYTLEAPLYYSTSDNPAIRIKNDDGDYVTDALADGAVNQTNLAVGETFSMDFEFTGTSLESSGEGIYVIEFPAGSSTNITSVQLSGTTTANIPTIHTTNNAGSKVVAFNIPASVGSAKNTYTLTVSLASTKDLWGGVYTDWYAKQEFVDDNGQISYGVEDSDGTAKYENTLDFDFYIASE